METANLQIFEQGDIVKISNGDSVTIAKVVESNETGVKVFRDPEDVWYSLNEYSIEKLGVAH